MNARLSQERPHWTVDRRLPIAMLIGIATQTIALVAVGSWFMSALETRVTSNEGRIAQQFLRVEAVEHRQQASDTVTARLEERLIAQGVTLVRIERLLEQVQVATRRMEEK